MEPVREIIVMIFIFVAIVAICSAINRFLNKRK